MIVKVINNSTLVCPQPVINTKKAIEGGLPVKSIVDNEIAKENVLKLCNKMGLKAQVNRVGENFEIIIADQELEVKTEHPDELEGTFLIKTKSLGEGDEKLGEGLMKAFIYTLSQRTTAPKKIMFLNSGVFLVATGSQLLELLKSMEDRGTEITSCGACLDFYNLKESLGVGTVTNMYDILENLIAGDVISL